METKIIVQNWLDFTERPLPPGSEIIEQADHLGFVKLNKLIHPYTGQQYFFVTLPGEESTTLFSCEKQAQEQFSAIKNAMVSKKYTTRINEAVLYYLLTGTSEKTNKQLSLVFKVSEDAMKDLCKRAMKKLRAQKDELKK